LRASPLRWTITAQGGIDGQTEEAGAEADNPKTIDHQVGDCEREAKRATTPLA